VPDSSFSGANPFTALTFITAPAILTNAASVLAMSTSNRFLRASERIRALAEQLAKLERGTPEETLVLVQVERIERQSIWLLGALRGAYVALGAFAVASLVSLVGASLAGFSGLRGLAELSLIVALLSGAIGVAALVAACVRLFHATRLSMRNISDEAANIRRLRGQATLASPI
jgi:hypothetical protein